MTPWTVAHQAPPSIGFSRQEYWSGVPSLTVREMQNKPLMSLLLLLLSRFSRVRLCATHRWQPTRLPHPWDSPGKNTEVGCHFLLRCMKVESESEVAQSCLTLATPWTAAYQAPLPMGFSRQEYRSTGGHCLLHQLRLKTGIETQL